MSLLIIETIKREGKKNKLVRITYTDSKGMPSNRVVEPYEIKNMHLFAYCTDKHGMRCFNTQQITSASPTGVSFAPRWEVKL